MAASSGVGTTTTIGYAARSPGVALARATDAPALTGRVSEQAELVDAVAGVAGGPSCLEIVGEPGIGKTTMLARLAQLAAAAGVRVFAGRGSEFEHGEPFGIVVEALDVCLGGLDERWFRSFGSDVVAELAEIFPALRAPVAGPAPADVVERFRAHRAIRALLERLAIAQPIALVLDDVHWADSSSLELIGTLLRRPPAARVLLVLSYRSRQIPAPLVRELEAADRAGGLRRIELGPLSREETDLVLAGDVSASERERLFVESGGNPFYLQQLARAFRGTREGRDIGSGVPVAIAASLEAELEAVSRPARALAQAAAVAGDPFDLDLAADIAGVEREPALAALDEPVAADLLRANGAALHFAFRHPLVRRAIYESVQPGRRIAAHARADAAMARRGEAPAARAHHVEQSARIGDREAAELLIQAADAALVPAAAARWLKAALRLVPADGDDGVALRCRLGATLASAGLIEEGRAILADVLERWPRSGDQRARTGLIVACAQVERRMGRHEQAHARLSAAASELDGLTSREGAAIAAELAWQHVLATRWDRAREPATAALREAVAVGDRALRLSATMAMAFAEINALDIDRARTLLADATALAARLSDDEAVSIGPTIFFTMGVAALRLDRYEEAGAHQASGIALARATGHSYGFILLRSGWAEALTYQGKVAEAKIAVDEAVEAARLAARLEEPLTIALMMSCVVHRASGDLMTAISHGREAMSVVVDDSSTFTIASRVWLGTALVEAGDWAHGAGLILAGAGSDLERVLATQRPLLYDALTLAALGLGDVNRAAELAGRAAALLEGVDCELPRAFADRAVARVLLARGDARAAGERALASADRAASVGARVEAGRSRVLAARALAAAARREEAVEQLRATEVEMAACGAMRVREQCVQELRRIGVRVSYAGRRSAECASGTDALSRREREVAELVCGRYTNREIAERLFLSEKTVESHLRSIFMKLGVTSRVQVARAFDADP